MDLTYLCTESVSLQPEYIIYQEQWQHHVHLVTDSKYLHVRCVLSFKIDAGLCLLKEKQGVESSWYGFRQGGGSLWVFF